MPFGLGIGELVLIVALVTLVFGAKRIPEIASGLGRGIRNFKTEVKSDDRSLPRESDRGDEDTHG